MRFIKKNFYPLSFAVLILFVGMILIFRPSDSSVPPLKNRIGALAVGAEWLNTKSAVAGLTDQIRKNPNDPKPKISLAEAYIQEARITGNYNYYDLAAIKLLNEVLVKDASNFEAQVTLATVYLSQHHFRDGLAIGLKAQKLNPYSSYVYGVLTDAYVELGKYDSAVFMADKMCATRPDLRSYSRISYVREILGDMPGAISAMKMAVAAGYPGLEQTEWSRINLGKLYEQIGEPDSAELQYEVALSERANYAYALAGLGRVAAERKNYAQATTYFEQANSLVEDYSFGDELIDLYRMNNEPKKADSIAGAVIASLTAQANSNDQNINAGHYTDKELAYVYLKTGDLTKALQHAQAEYNRRPDNIDVNELMAWVYYKQGDAAKAAVYADKALRTGKQDPVLLCRAGLIYCRNNETDKGSMLIQKAVSIDPYLQQDLLAEAKPYIPAPLASANY